MGNGPVFGSRLSHWPIIFQEMIMVRTKIHSIHGTCLSIPPPFNGPLSFTLS